MAEAATVAGGSAASGPNVGSASPAMDSPRGALVIDNRVGEKIAARAALDVDGVVPYATAISSLIGGAARSGHSVDGDDYPRARVDMSQSAPVVNMTVALRWPCPITAVCQEVRRHVADQLAALTGLRPSAVNVTVAHLDPVPGASRRDAADGSGPSLRKTAKSSRTRRGFIELPAAAPAPDEADTAELPTVTHDSKAGAT